MMPAYSEKRRSADAARIGRDTNRLIGHVVRRDGVMSTRSLIRAGFSRHRIQSALEGGHLLRVRRAWVAVPGADAQLIAAARAGTVLTCVTQARRLSLWVLEDDVPHVGCAPTHHASAPGSRVHWAQPPVPRDPETLVDPIENVLAILAGCQPFEPALAVWESALNKGMVSLDAMRRLELGPAAREICRVAVPWSDSGLESFVAPRIAWMGIPFVPQVWIAGHRVDFLIGARLVLQIDGGSHVGEQREEDNAHDALLALMGYHVIRVGYRQVVGRWHEVQGLLMRAVAQGFHRV